MNKSLLLASVLASGQLWASDIPDRRDFPVNDEVKPCENFYQYACSKVVDSFELPDDRSRHTFSFSDSRERLLERKKTYLHELDKRDKRDKRSPRAETLNTVYGACMNESARKKEETNLIAQLRDQLKKIKSRPEFLDFVAEQRKKGYFSFVDVGSTANQDNPDIYDFYFIVDMMTLPERSYYQNKSLVQDYEKLVAGFFTTHDEKNAAKRAKTLVAFEKEFAENYPLPAEMRELFVKKSSITKEKIKKLYPSLRLDADLKQVPDKLNIRHFTPDNYKFVETKLQNTPLATLKDLYLFHSAFPIMDDAYPQFFKTKFEFNHEHLGGPKTRPDRQERCTKWVMGRFRKEIDAELLPEIFPDFPQEKFVKLAESVRGSIIEGVQENTWLSDEGKKGAIAKLKAARLQLVKPQTEEEWYFNPPVDYHPEHHLENSRRLDLALTQRMYDELDEKRNKDRWWMGPLTINAYYSPSDNKFVMPIGILQYPFYDPKLPPEINLGAVGAVIGHELGHGIDDKGAKYDAKGRLKQWMSDEDLENFKAAGEQFIAQFDNAGHNGKLTLGENIGDWTGLTFAYRAAFPENKGKTATKKKFFLQYARLWCGVTRPKMKERLLKTDPHPLGYARVNEQVKHQPGFAEAYQCKKGQPMYLSTKERIKIW